MSSNAMYNILGKLKSVFNADALTPDTPATTDLYESVEPRGSISEAVKNLEAKFQTFKESAKPDFLDVDKDGNKKEPFKKAVKDKKDNKGWTPERIAAMKQKGSWNGQVDEMVSDEEAKAQRDATKDRAWKAKGEANTKKYEKNKKASEKRAQERAAKKVSESEEITDLDSYQFAEPDTDTAIKPASAKQAAAEKRRRLQDIEDRRAEKDDWFSGKDRESNVRIHKAKLHDEPEEIDEYSQSEYDQAISDFASKGGKAQQLPPGSAKNPISTASRHIAGKGEAGKGKTAGRGAKTDATGKPVVDVYEKAPPGAKAERMVKHIKKGYADDGKLTKKEKGIAYATAWKAHNKGQVEEGCEFGDTVKNSTPNMKKAKAKLKEGRDMSKSQYFDENVAQALANEQPGLDTSSPSFNEAVYNEIIAQGMTAKAARNIMLTDEDFLGDVASAYAYFCKHNNEVAECNNPMLQAPSELDEIARLAGLPTREEELDEREQFQSMPKAAPAPVPAAPAAKPGISVDKSKLNPMREEEMEEGNEFSGALAAAKASGQKEFEVDGKKYTVKEDINVNVTASGEEDALNLFRKLAGMPEVHVEPEAVSIADLVQDDGLEEERDIEYTNTPRERIAPMDAAYPSGSDLNRSKKQDPRTANRAANPLTDKVEESLWAKYEDMIKDIKG